MTGPHEDPKSQAQNLLSGVLLALFGFLGLWFGRGLPTGTLARMGPGYLPTALSILLLLIGAVLIIMGLRARVGGAPLGGIGSIRFGWRPLVFVLGAAAAFGALIDRMGLVIAAVAAVLLAAAASRESRWREAPLLAMGLAAFVVLLFVKGLGMLLPIWPR